MKVKHDNMLSNVAFHFHLRHYSTETQRWNRFYAMTNVMFGPLLILHIVKDVVPESYPVLDLGANTGYLPLWAAVLGLSTVVRALCFGLLRFPFTIRHHFTTSFALCRKE